MDDYPDVLLGFSEQVTSRPGSVAVSDHDVRLDYAEFDDRINRLAHLLIDRGAGPGKLVALVLPASVDLLTAMFAVLRSGAAYLPVDPADPESRVRYLLEDACPDLVLAGSPEQKGGPKGTDVLFLGAEPVRAELRRSSASRPERRAGGLDAAYVIYTSGSTGRPKGVVVERRALSAYLEHVSEHYRGLDSGVAPLHSSAAFDMAVTSIYGPLSSGGRVHVAELDETTPTFLKVTPSHLAMLEVLPRSCLPTDELVIGGEALFSTAVEAWRVLRPRVRLVNEYGPTEATVGCCVHFVQPDDPMPPGPVSIGRPTAGTRLYVLDSLCRPVPPGAPGELYIAGSQLARGYLGKAALTSCRFVANPFGPPGTRMYRTGDLVRQEEDGTLTYLGRLDDQVKINGHRIELGEVQAAVLTLPQMAVSAVVVRNGPQGARELVVYFVPPDKEQVDVREMRELLAEMLPEYMVPSRYVALAELPLTANGKVDTAALPDPIPVREHARPKRAAPAEVELCQIVGSLLGTTAVAPDDDFYELGGNSVTAAMLVSAARKYGFRLDLRDIPRLRTVRSFAAETGRASDAPPDGR
ncbi:non-ribosomal peptide synthetase [Amycolatopsis lurida]|uniref:non-ribosomal peptide synthetase n=1 Tax=Amycolatopsis lurida TaxID=31959 RepID=UPI0036595193